MRAFQQFCPLFYLNTGKQGCMIRILPSVQVV
jgi:hypothetical protein